MESYWRKAEQHVLPLAGRRRTLNGSTCCIEDAIFTAFGASGTFNQAFLISESATVYFDLLFRAGITLWYSTVDLVLVKVVKDVK